MRVLKGFFALFIFCCWSLPAAASVERFIEGVHYKKLATPAQEATQSQEVLEFFWYGCPHCYDLEAELAAWVETLPKEVAFRRIPALFRSVWKTHGQAYFAAEALGVADASHEAFFKAIHEERKSLHTEALLQDFYQQFGVDEARFSTAFKSFPVHLKLVEAMQLAQKYRVTGVPTFVVNQKYVTSIVEARDNQTLLEILNFLLAKESATQAD